MNENADPDVRRDISHFLKKTIPQNYGFEQRIMSKLSNGHTIAETFVGQKIPLCGDTVLFGDPTTRVAIQRP